MITDIEDYFAKGCGRCDRFATPSCSTKLWSQGLASLRDICRDMNLFETVKWGHPCYMHADRNIAILGAFRDNFRITFMNAGLLKDKTGPLERQGPNSSTPNMLRFTENDAVAAHATLIRAYLVELMDYADRGIKPPKTKTEYDIPDELIDALDSDPDLAEAFDALTPGRKRGYYMHIGSAKQAATRSARIEKLRPRIFAGIGFNERERS